MEAKSGKEREAEDPRQSRSLIYDETGTTTFFALKVGPSTYYVFTNFTDIASRKRTKGESLPGTPKRTMRGLFYGRPTRVRSIILDAKHLGGANARDRD